MTVNDNLSIHRITAILGFITAAPVILFVAANVAIYELGLFRGIEVIQLHPALLLGGGLAAILLNAWSTLDFRITREHGKLWFICGISNRPWNLAVLIVTVSFVALLVSYVLIENLVHAFAA